MGRRERDVSRRLPARASHLRRVRGPLAEGAGAGAGACPTHEHAPKEPLGWQNSRLLKGDVAAAVAALKREDGKYLLAIGSTELVQTLIAHNLANEFRMMIDPVVLGGGKRVFDDDGVLKSLRLVSSEVTATGAILATYARAAS